jgi:hypothetical protein
MIVCLCVASVFAAKPEAAKETDPRLHADGKGWRLQKAKVEDPKRPRVLMIGDSILNGYLDGVSKALDGKAYIDAWVTPTSQADKQLPRIFAEILAQGPYDVIHFNMGLHGWQKGRIPDGQYEPLTQAMVRKLRELAPKATLIWCSTTPVTTQGKPGELDAEINPIIVEHNRMAAKVMAEEHVQINDLYGLMVQHLDLARGDRFHWTDTGRELQVKQVAETVAKALEARAAQLPK